MSEEIDDLRDSLSGLESEVEDLQRAIRNCDTEDIGDLIETIEDIENMVDSLEYTLKELDRNIDTVEGLVESRYPSEDNIFELAHYAQDIQLVTWTDVDKMNHLARVFNSYSLHELLTRLPLK